MDPSLLLDNLLSPPVLFFALGAAAAAVRSDLVLPEQVTRFLGQLLLVVIGLTGGKAVAAGGIGGEILLAGAVAVAFGLVTPLVAYPILHRFLGRADAAAVAATFGSCSAVTFMTAIAFLDARGDAYSGAMTAVLALLEAPAIVIGIALARGLRGQDKRKILHESACNGAVLLLLGSMVIGAMIRGPSAGQFMTFISEAKLPLLSLFMLDMGLLAASKIAALRAASWRLIAFALLAPAVLWFAGIGAGQAIGLGLGDTLLLTMLVSSASYIAVPAALRISVPEANPGIYVPQALALVFPLNVALGIPVVYALLGGDS